MGRDIQSSFGRDDEIPVPRRGAVDRLPLVFDTRSQAWRIVFPDTPEAADPRRPLNQWPRQRAATSCNLIQLYERLRTAIQYYQMEWVRPPGGAQNVLVFRYAMIEPRKGWKLRNRTTDVEYEVRGVGRRRNDEDSFDGTVYLVGTSGPSEGDWLEWVDPTGALDGEEKLVQLQPHDSAGNIMEARETSGDLAGGKKKPFAPRITYRLKRDMPGATDGQPFGDRKEIKPRLRDGNVYDPLDPQSVIEIWGQWHDIVVEFRCYSIDPTVVDRVSLWFQNFARLYTGVLKILGVQEMFPWQVDSADIDGKVTQNLNIRAVQYYFRLEDISVARLPRLKTFEIATRIFDAETGLVAGETSRTAESEWDVTHDTSDNYLYGDLDIGDDF